MAEYSSPRALESAMKEYAKQEAAATGLNVGDILQRFYYQRLLARVFTDDPEGWLVKGGQALLVRYSGRARASRDIDLYRPGDGDTDEALDALRRAANRDLGDYFSYQIGTVTPTGSGIRVLVGVTIGVQTRGQFKVDVVVGKLMTGAPTIAPLTPAFRIDWPADWPEVRLYPLQDHVADKICAMYEWRADKPSSRFRDLADLLLIAQNEDIDGPSVVNALRSEEGRRLSIGTDLRLPSKFEVPDNRTWPAGYTKEAKQVAGLRGCQTIGAAKQPAATFLDPVLAKSAKGLWMKATQAWSLPGE